MPGVLSPVSYEPIKAVRMMGSNAATPATQRQPEAISLTVKLGVPMMLDGSGNLVEFTSSGANIVFGVTNEPGHNLAVAATAQDENEGTPTNQVSAITTAVGAWPRDGFIGVYLANGQNVFSIALKATQVFTQALLIAGTYYGLTKDATTGQWYLDNTVTTGNSAVAELLGVDSSCPNTSAGGSRVFFIFASTKRYFV